MMFTGDWLDSGGEDLILEAVPECNVRLLADFAAIARQVVPQSFLNQMQNGATSLLIGDVLMVHAGLDPERDAFDFLSEPRQAVVGSNHWAWIKEPFLHSKAGWGPKCNWAVIHGQTPAVDRLVTADDFEQQADKLLVRINRVIASVRAKVEHPFRVIKRQFGHVKTRYSGIAKNRAQLFTLFALGNPILVRTKLPA